MALKVKRNTLEYLERDRREIRYVVHLSDIHIRKNTRIKEYREVFNRLFDKLNELNLNNVIVVTGDIIHDKSILTGESVNLLKDFF